MTLKKQVWTFLAYGMVILSTLLLSWCFWSSWKNMDTSQIISFSSYKMDITNNYTQNSVDERIDPRIAWKIISLYVNRSWEWYEDNIVISLDKLSPSASLEDYVQAAIGVMSYTRWKYQSLAYQKNNLTCQALTIPTVSNTFSIVAQMMFMSITLIGLGFQYFNLAERLDGTGMRELIASIGTNKTLIPDEGEY